MANNHGYTDAELDAADAEMAEWDDSVMQIGGHLAADEQPRPLSVEESAAILRLLEDPPKPTVALVALLRRLGPTEPA